MLPKNWVSGAFPNICFIGSMFKYQGVDVLIDTAKILAESELPCRFLIIGEGPMKQHWIEKVNLNNLRQSIVFFGQIEYEALPFYINASDICVAPYLKEAGLCSPVKIFDYLSCGRPVIASKLSGVTDVFEVNSLLQLVTAGDPMALKKAILQLLADPILADKFGTAGRSFVVNQFSREKIAWDINIIARNLMKCR